MRMGELEVKTTNVVFGEYISTTYKYLSTFNYIKTSHLLILVWWQKLELMVLMTVLYLDLEVDIKFCFKSTIVNSLLGTISTLLWKK